VLLAAEVDALASPESEAVVADEVAELELLVAGDVAAEVEPLVEVPAALSLLAALVEPALDAGTAAAGAVGLATAVAGAALPPAAGRETGVPARWRLCRAGGAIGSHSRTLTACPLTFIRMITSRSLGRPAGAVDPAGALGAEDGAPAAAD